MSFILDALRKSEHDRDRRILPGIVEAPKARMAGHHLRWIIALCAALFVLNSAALLYLLLRAPTSSTVPATPAAQPEPPVPSAATNARTPSQTAAPVGAVRSLADEAMVGSRSAPYADVPPTPHVRMPTVSRDTPPPAGVRVEVDPATTGLPTRRQLPPALASALPPITVDLHVYSPQPAQRFMVISGQRALEGATVAGGIVIEKITPDGAIAVFRGTRFLLTRD